MKKIFSVIAIAAMAVFAFSCKPDGPETPDDIDNIVEDGVYVMLGDKIEAAYAMAGGLNEAAEQAARDGMFEKYIILEKDQEFTLAYKAGEKVLKYGATLAPFKPEKTEGIYGDNPADEILKGALVEGDNAPKMKAAKKALYHIVLDLNKDNALAEAQILVAEVQYGVRGGMNNWGFTALEAGELSNAGTTFTLTNQELGNNGEFKFAYNGAWKITLDAEGKVKANTNLGWAENKKDLAPGGANIVAADGAGKYKVTLTFKLAGGPVGNSWSYTLEQESKASYPEHIYMTGNDFGAWTWGSEGIVELQHISAGGDPKDGCFVTTRYIKAANPVKFNENNVKDDWSKSFGVLTNKSDNITTDNDGNLVVPQDGLWTITIDYTADKITLTEGKIFGMGDCFGGNWDAAKAVEGVVNADGTASITTQAAGNFRTFAPCAFDWWQHEFIPTADGKIAYREGGELEGFAVEAGVTVTYNFNEGTATIGGGVEPPIKIDGDFSDWDEIEGAEPADAFKAFKVYNDADNFYFYVETDPGSRLWSGGAYLYLYFDFDNDLTTGAYSGSTGMGANSYEAYAFMYLFKGTADAPEVATDANGGEGQGVKVANIVVAGNQPASSSDIVKMEIKIPRADFTDQVKAGDVIGVGSYRSKDGGNIHLAGYTVL